MGRAPCPRVGGGGRPTFVRQVEPLRAAGIPEAGLRSEQAGAWRAWDRSPPAKLSKGFSKCMLYVCSMDAFHALAEPNRRKVVEMLARRGRLSASEICAGFEVTPQAVSQHLKVLREASVIRMEKQAQRRLYTFNPKSMNQVQEWVTGLAKLWNRRLDRLDKALREERP